MLCIHNHTSHSLLTYDIETYPDFAAHSGVKNSEMQSINHL
eukprot:Gb_22408 [translate_table: standard]